MTRAKITKLTDVTTGEDVPVPRRIPFGMYSGLGWDEEVPRAIAELLAPVPLGPIVREDPGDPIPGRGPFNPSSLDLRLEQRRTFDELDRDIRAFLDTYTPGTPFGRIIRRIGDEVLTQLGNELAPLREQELPQIVTVGSTTGDTFDGAITRRLSHPVSPGRQFSMDRDVPFLSNSASAGFIAGMLTMVPGARITVIGNPESPMIRRVRELLAVHDRQLVVETIDSRKVRLTSPALGIRIVAVSPSARAAGVPESPMVRRVRDMLYLRQLMQGSPPSL